MNTAPKPQHRRRWRTLTLVLATALLVAPAAAFATGGFNDVDESDFFSDAVAWMKDNGVTVGCNPPDNTRYCPDDFVTRGQMAVFMERLDTKNVFLRPGDAIDADKLDGLDSSDFSTVAWVKVDGDLTIVDQSGGWVLTDNGSNGSTRLDHPNIDESGVGFAASIYRASGEGTAPGFVSIFANNESGFQVRTYNAAGTASDEGYSIVISLEPGDLEAPISGTAKADVPADDDNL